MYTVRHDRNSEGRAADARNIVAELDGINELLELGERKRSSAFCRCFTPISRS
ncbi:MAG: hypothetical protein IPJ30_12125 [Acidobacteria bacterium]|nr:hypothetical protein [Acidobacteriota bacterium]